MNLCPSFEGVFQTGTCRTVALAADISHNNHVAISGMERIFMGYGI